MLKYNEQEGYLHLYVNETLPDYSISLDELEKTANWNLFQIGGGQDRIIPDVSDWILHLRSKADVTTDFLIDLGELIKERVPGNKIDWQATYKAVEIVNEYRSRTAPQGSISNGVNRISFKDLPARIERKKSIADELIKKYNL